jgi:hypothetical protein
MRYDVGTWGASRDGVPKLVSKPKSGIPDPNDPANRVQTFVKNKWGRIVPVTRMSAVEMINEKGAKLATEAEYEEYNKEHKDDEPQASSTMIREIKERGVADPVVTVPLEKPVEIPDTAQKPESLGTIARDVPEKPNEIKEMLLVQGKKFDELTKAILKLAESKGKST